MQSRRRAALLAVSAALAFWGGAARLWAGPSGAGYNIAESGLVPGGSVAATGGGFSLAGSMGGPSATRMAGGGFSLAPGIVAAQRPATDDLTAAHPYPVPFIPSQGHTEIVFTRLSPKVTIKVWSLSGELVKTIIKDSATDDRVRWTPVVNDAGQSVASGVYLWTMTDSAGHTATGKLMVIK